MDSFMNIANNVENVIKDGEGGLGSVLDKNIGIFLDCKEIAGQQVIQGIYIIYFPRLQGDCRTTELKTLEWWILRSMFDLLFFLIPRLNNACSPLVINLVIQSDM